MTEPVIEARGLTRRFGELTAVDALDLSVAPQTIYGFLGPNGCGKTTTVRMLTGLLTPSAGEVTVLGHALPRDAERLKRQIGYMTQRFSLYDDLSVSENLRFVAEIYGLGRRAARRRIDALLATYALEPMRHRRAGQMSGGQRQRLALAAATLHSPSLLFLDEPTSAVDPENRRDFWERLFDLVEGGATILVSTHYMDEAERCHRLAIMERGHKRADGSPAELMAAMGARVVEVEGRDLRRLKPQITRLPEVISAAQLGSRLRVLVRDRVADPVAWLQAQALDPSPTRLTQVRPSLEDVFVTSTGRRIEASADDGREGRTGSGPGSSGPKGSGLTGSSPGGSSSGGCGPDGSSPDGSGSSKNDHAGNGKPSTLASATPAVRDD
ncbi:ABC transporter ATP-binding protein [Halochromatium glycolicum]|uniref:ABC transporter ATP-binding protein n=1 Tax=Halochromatium glycolicum TaxID=85075 RepID=UPI001F5BEDC1|nr:ABC transporter ATP-binding protein [Halochromatium glycolicum]